MRPQNIPKAASQPGNDGEAVVSSFNNDAHIVALQWGAWHRSRFLLSPARLPPNLLAAWRMPAGSGELPDVGLSAKLTEYNRAVSHRPESDDKLAFLAYYLYGVPMRAITEHFERSRRTVFGYVEREREAIYLAHLKLICNHFADENVLSFDDHMKRLKGPARARGGVNGTGTRRAKRA